MSFEPLARRDASLTRNWYVACLAHELTAARPLAREIYDRPLALFRDEAGKARCLPDRCLHRHARLSSGTVIRGRLTCPYHGWAYDSEGRVAHVPSRGPQGEPPGYCHKPLATAEQDGCVWVWLGEGEPPGPPPFRFPSASRPGWASYVMITDFENEVGHLAENFMDVPHTVFVHKGWFRTQALREVPIKVETANGTVLVTYQQPNDVIGFSGFVLNPNKSPMVHTDKFILPNITRVDYTFSAAAGGAEESGFIITSQITPVSTLQCRVYTEICYKLAGPSFLGRLLSPFMHFYTRRVIEQDVRIMANQAENLRRELRPPHLDTEADVIHAEIQALRRLAAAGDGQAFTRVKSEARTIWI